MRRTLMLAALVTVLVGCGRKTPPPPLATPPPALPPGSVAVEGGGPAANTVVPEPIYQGRTVTQWNEALQARDPMVRSQASVALGQMGPQGSSKLLEVMMDRRMSEDVCLLSMQALSREQLAGQPMTQQRLVQVLRGARDPQLRRAAASRLCWYETNPGRALPDLEVAAANDPDPSVRQAATDSIGSIKEFIGAGGKRTRGVRPPAKK